MGKHASGEPNYRVAKGPLFAVLAVILIAAVIIAWFNFRSINKESENTANSACSRGDLTLNVTTDPVAVGDVQKLVQSYGESNPVVKDFCVRPQIRVAGSQEVLDVVNKAGEEIDPNQPVLFPGAWVPADVSFVDKAKQAKDIAVEEPTAWLRPISAGVAVADNDAATLKDVTWADIAARKVATPGGSDAVLSAVVDASLGGGEEAAKERAALGDTYTSDALLPRLMTDDAKFDTVAATKPMLDMAGDGLTFIEPKDAPQLHAPIVTFGSGGPIDENTARAAADFADYVKKHGANGEASQSTISGDAAALLPVLSAIKTNPFAGMNDPAAPTGTEGSTAPSSAPNAANAAGKLGSALVLLDASAGVDIAAVRDALVPLLGKATSAEGTRIALWNYSSPQSEGVTNPARANVLFAPGTNGAAGTEATLNQISAVGEPWMWQSLTAAYGYAVENYAEGMPNRVVLVATGADTSGADAKATVEEIKKLIKDQRKVAIDVVLLPGSGPASAELKDVAAATGGTVSEAPRDSAGLSKNLANALGVKE